MKNLILRYFLITACAMAGMVQAAPPVTVPDTPETLPAGHHVLTFDDLGWHKPIALWGMQGSNDVNFSVRADEIITQAKVRLTYSWSPSLIPPLSQLRVLLNGHVIQTLPLPKEHAGNPVSQDIVLDPRLLGDYNQLRFQLIGYYTEHCQDPVSPLLWVNVSNLSELEVEVSPLPQVNDLARFPEPFFDKRDPSMLQLPFVVPQDADDKTLEAAAILSSWFGARADWRGADFPVAHDLSEIKGRYGVVVATDTILARYLPGYFKNHPQIEGPTVAVITPENRPYGKLLLVLGRNSEELREAAVALTTSTATLSGPVVTFKAPRHLAPRKPYDAPRWVALDRPVKFGELTGSDDLQVKGHIPGPINVDLHIPPDLFFWDSKGVPLDLKYRYSPPIDTDESRLSLFLNNSFVQTFNLYEKGQGGIKKHVRLPVPGATLVGGNSVLLPTYKLGMQNRLRFDFTFAYHKKGECQDTVLDNTIAAIDADSQIDFSGFPHYAEMPNLHYFAESGYPFTRMADLSETQLYMSSRPASQDVRLMLAVMGRLGAITGYPVTGLDIVLSTENKPANDKDILIIGSRVASQMFRQWDISPNNGAFKDLSIFSEPVERANRWDNWTKLGKGPNTEAAAQVTSFPSGTLGALIGFQSPQSSEHSVVAMTANQGDGLDAIRKGLLGNDTRSKIQGSATFFRGKEVDAIEDVLVGDTYHLGNLPPWTLLWYKLSHHPLALSLITLATIVILAIGLWAWLRRRAARRLAQKQQA